MGDISVYIRLSSFSHFGKLPFGKRAVLFLSDFLVITSQKGGKNTRNASLESCDQIVLEMKEFGIHSSSHANNKTSVTVNRARI